MTTCLLLILLIYLSFLLVTGEEFIMAFLVINSLFALVRRWVQRYVPVYLCIQSCLHMSMGTLLYEGIVVTSMNESIAH